MNSTTNRKFPLVNTILTIPISLVWLFNGLFCKLLDFVPRHEAIVARIPGMQHATFYKAHWCCRNPNVHLDHQPVKAPLVCHCSDYYYCCNECH